MAWVLMAAHQLEWVWWGLGILVIDLASVSVQVLKAARELSLQVCQPARLVSLHAGHILKIRA